MVNARKKDVRLSLIQTDGFVRDTPRIFSCLIAPGPGSRLLRSGAIGRFPEVRPARAWLVTHLEGRSTK
jgi:hypothetical protein